MPRWLEPTEVGPHRGGPGRGDNELWLGPGPDERATSMPQTRAELAACSRAISTEVNRRTLEAASSHRPCGGEALHDLGGLRRELLRQGKGEGPGCVPGLGGTGVDGSGPCLGHRHQLGDLIANTFLG